MRAHQPGARKPSALPKAPREPEREHRAQRATAGSRRTRQPLQAKKGNTQPPRAGSRQRQADSPPDGENTTRATPQPSGNTNPQQSHHNPTKSARTTTSTPARRRNRTQAPQRGRERPHRKNKHGGQSTAEQSRRAEIRPPPPSTAAPNRTTTKTPKRENPKREIKPTHGNGANHHAPKLPARASQRNHTRHKDSERGADQHNGGAPLQPTQNKPKQPRERLKPFAGFSFLLFIFFSF